MAANLDITIARNEVWARQFQLTDPTSGEPFDITGCSFEGQVKSPTDNADIIASFTFDILDAVNGLLNPTLDAREGTALSEYGDPLQSVSLRYDIRATDYVGNKADIFTGNVILNRGVTQDG